MAKGWTVYGSVRSAVTDPDAHICEHPGFHDPMFDVTDHDAVLAAAASVKEPIDILIRNAGSIGQERHGWKSGSLPAVSGLRVCDGAGPSRLRKDGSSRILIG
ncbi:hypothetical protein ACK6D9_18905 [Hoeflea sp. Naph1]|uniref:hypothetical protein n=1 Tax=Hoeflea sp. Naph1 TaxID=3388653 RepID=UPI0039902A68